MRYVQLKAFHNVAIFGGFSRAAAALHVTQPAISDQVRKLEADYDIKLFDRSRKQVAITEAGAALLTITHRLFESEQQAFELLSESRALRMGTLRIVADSAHHMTEVLTSFRREFPDVFVSIKSGNSEQVLELLNSYDAEIGVMGSEPDTGKHDVVPLDSALIVAFAAMNSVFAKQDSVSLKELSSWPLVMREKGSKTRAKLEEQAHQAGLSLNIAIEAEGREAVRQIVSGGGGVGVVSEAEFTAGEDIQSIQIRDAPLTMDESIVCLRERRENRLINRFMQLAMRRRQAMRE